MPPGPKFKKWGAWGAWAPNFLNFGPFAPKPNFFENFKILKMSKFRKFQNFQTFEKIMTDLIGLGLWTFAVKPFVTYLKKEAKSKSKHFQNFNVSIATLHIITLIKPYKSPY
jgi:hypothetical protein